MTEQRYQRYEFGYSVPNADRTEHERWLLEWGIRWVDSTNAECLEVDRIEEIDATAYRIVVKTPADVFSGSETVHHVSFDRLATQHR